MNVLELSSLLGDAPKRITQASMRPRETHKDTHVKVYNIIMLVQHTRLVGSATLTAIQLKDKQLKTTCLNRCRTDPMKLYKVL